MHSCADDRAKVGVNLRRRPVRVIIRAAACAFAAAFLALPAEAQQTQWLLGPLRVRLEQAVTWDANVFRVRDGAPDPQLARGITGKSDRFTATTFGLDFDKAYSLQNFHFDVNETAFRYDKFESNNRDSLNYRGAWLWQLTPRITGTVSTDHAESVVAFSDTVNNRLNKTSIDNRVFSVDGWLFGGWHLVAGITQTDRKNSTVFLAQPSYQQTTELWGLRYEWPSLSSLALTSRVGRGTLGQNLDVANFADTGYRTRDTELNGIWVASGRSRVTARLTRTERTYDHIPQLSFSGTGGTLAYLLQPTGKVDLELSATRSVLPWTEIGSGTYRIDDALAFTPVWRISDKVSVNLRASRLVSNFLGAVNPGPQRRDVFNSLSLGASWQPYSKLTVRATLQRIQRTSTDPTLPFTDQIGSLSALLAF